jgi:multiple sugar transport system substrate-binding protein
MAVGAGLPTVSVIAGACSRGRAPRAQAQSPAHGRPTTTAAIGGTVTIMVGLGRSADPRQAAVQQSVAQAYVLAHPQVQVNFERVAQAVAASRITGEGGRQRPDLVLPSGVTGISRFVDAGVWQDLRPRLDAERVDVADLFVPPSVGVARATDYYGDGSRHVVGLPIAVHAHVMAVNVDLFRKAGVPAPAFGWDDADWTYDKLLDLARATTLDTRKRRSGQPGFDPRAIAQYGLARIDDTVFERGFGADVPYDPRSRRVGYGSDQFAAGLQFVADLVNRHHVLPTGAAAAALGRPVAGADPRLALWLAGRAAMAEVCVCELRPWGDVKGFRWTAVALPRGPRRLAAPLDVDMGAIVAGAGSDRDASWDVLAGMVLDPSRAGVLAVEGLGAVPALREASPLFADAMRREHPDLDVAILLDAVAHGTTDAVAWHPAYDRLVPTVEPMLAPVYAGAMPAAEAAPRAAEAAQRLVEEWLASHPRPHP